MTKPRTTAQRARQDREYRSKGKYSAVNPCCACGKSAGVDYCSHPLTDAGSWGDKALVLCDRCYEVTADMTDVQDFLTYKARFGDAADRAWEKVRGKDREGPNES